MNKIKLAIIFYSMTGVNYQMAQWAKEAAEQTGAEVRLRRVQELAPEEVVKNNPAWAATAEQTKDLPVATSEDLDWADAILFSAPTRFGVMAAQMKQFIDQQGGLWSEGKLMNKAVSAMSSAQNPHGGQEMTVQSIYTTMMHWGAVIVPVGYTDDSVFEAGGNPYGTSATQGEDGKAPDSVAGSVKHQAKRLVQVAGWLKQGQNQ